MSIDSLRMGISNARSSNVYAINSRIAEFRRCVSLTHTLNMFILTTFLSEPFSENKEHGKLNVFYGVSHTHFAYRMAVLQGAMDTSTSTEDERKTTAGKQ